MAKDSSKPTRGKASGPNKMMAPEPNDAQAQAWRAVLHRLDSSAAGPPADALGYAEFELDFEQALARQLGPFFEELPGIELTPENILARVAERARGAYYLLLNDELVYIGKSDAKAGLRARLLRHYKTLKRRKGIDWPAMKFKAVKVASLAALDTESLLLDLYKWRREVLGGPKRPEWNNSGFGSNDTGVERDTQKVSVFDQKYPLDLDALIDFEDAAPADTLTLDDYLKWLGKQLKFTFRRQAKRIAPGRELSLVGVGFAEMTASVRLGDLLEKVHGRLPSGWALTVLRGKVVLYLNDTAKYKSPIWTLEAGKPPGIPDYTLRSIGKVDDEAKADSELLGSETDATD